MKRFIKDNIYLVLIFAVSFFIFYRSLFVFYTNDDFFLLKISNATNVHDFLNFFNILRGPDGLAMYRPLTTQVYYFLAHGLFNLSPIPLHIISFVVFFAVIYLVYKLSFKLTKDDKIAAISAFLYTVSATHFGHLYYLAAFQELGMTLFVLLTCLMFINEKYFPSFIFFVLAMMSKETAVITPLLLLLIYLYRKYSGQKVVSFKKLLVFLLPFLLILASYMLIRVFYYGFASGDSYVWDFSIKRLTNTAAWYIAWSFNLPEMLVDFVGPGLHLNPNLLKYWSKEMIPIFILFTIQIFTVSYAFIKSSIRNHKFVFLFGVLWFLISLLPVAFLPIHKFTFYLTLPLIGVVLPLSFFLSKVHRPLLIIFFLLVWTVLSIFTLRLTYQTNWITQSEIVAARANIFFRLNGQSLSGKNIYFIDTTKDSNLPWSPTQTLKTVLSDKNFFDVFYPSLSANVNYAGLTKTPKSAGDQDIEARQFLGY